MLFDGASKIVVGCNSDLKHLEFIGLILGPVRGLTDIGAQQLVVGSSAVLRNFLTPSNMIATCGGNGTAKVVQVLDRAISGRGALVDRWKTTIHSTAHTNHDYAPAGSKHPNER